MVEQHRPRISETSCLLRFYLRWPNVLLLLGQRRRRSPNNNKKVDLCQHNLICWVWSSHWWRDEMPGIRQSNNIQGDVIIRMVRHSNQVVLIPADTNKAYRLFTIGPSFDMLTLRQCWLNRFMIYDSERWLMFTTCCTGTYISAPDTLVKWVCLRHGEVYVYKQRFCSNELA